MRAVEYATLAALRSDLLMEDLARLFSEELQRELVRLTRDREEADV